MIMLLDIRSEILFCFEMSIPQVLPWVAVLYRYYKTVELIEESCRRVTK